MKKSGFTMIELIFVIVVLGILAAVALPKFQAVGNQAHVGNLKSFTGTLNGTVGPSIWSKAVANHDGNISAQVQDDGTEDATAYVDIPKEISDVNLSYCDDASKFKIVATGNKAVNGDDYEIGCKDGDGTSSPEFHLYKDNVAMGGDANESKKIFPK